MILPMSDPFVRELRRLFSKSKSVEGMRPGSQMIGERLVEDAYVHRIAWFVTFRDAVAGFTRQGIQ